MRTCPRCGDGYHHTLDSDRLGMTATVFCCDTAVWANGTIQQGDQCAHVEAGKLRDRVTELEAENTRLRDAHDDISGRYETLLNQLGATDA